MTHCRCSRGAHAWAAASRLPPLPRSSDGEAKHSCRCCASTSHSRRRLRVGSRGGRISRVRPPPLVARLGCGSAVAFPRSLAGAQGLETELWRWVCDHAVWADTDAYMDTTAADEEQRVRAPSRREIGFAFVSYSGGLRKAARGFWWWEPGREQSGAPLGFGAVLMPCCVADGRQVMDEDEKIAAHLASKAAESEAAAAAAAAE
jgi:hypothetical protein